MKLLIMFVAMQWGQINSHTFTLSSAPDPIKSFSFRIQTVPDWIVVARCAEPAQIATATLWEWGQKNPVRLAVHSVPDNAGCTAYLRKSRWYDRMPKQIGSKYRG